MRVVVGTVSVDAVSMSEVYAGCPLVVSSDVTAFTTDEVGFAVEIISADGVAISVVDEYVSLMVLLEFDEMVITDDIFEALE